MPSIRTSSGAHFPQLSGESILGSGEKSGFRFPYSCRTGRCCSCKCKVIAGETVVQSFELGLTLEEKSEGWILSCVRTAVDDIDIDIEDLGRFDIPKPQILPCRINSMKSLSKDVLGVTLRLPPNGNFLAKPGQYIEVIAADGVRRSYSIANYLDNHLIELHIKKVANGRLSRYWFEEAKENDLLRLNGPLGTFFLRSIRNEDVVFLATGTGIAPVKSMLDSIECLAEEDMPNSVTVLWGGRISDDLYFDVSSDTPFFRYVPVLSRAPDNWNGERGYVQDVFVKEPTDLTSTTVYACGSDKMIHSARELLVNSGLPAKKFFSDAFVASAPIQIS